MSTRETLPDYPASPPSALPASAPVPGGVDSAILDVADGIERIMGDRDLYARMLARFRDDYRAGVQPIQAALSEADRALAHRRAHTLKGASGMIGAVRLHELACALEVAIRTNPAREQACLQALQPAFALLLHAIDATLAADGMQAPRPSAPTKPLLADGALLAQLVELLLAGDGAAVDMLEESGASLKAILGETRLEQVAAAVSDFDYGAALRALRQPAD